MRSIILLLLLVFGKITSAQTTTISGVINHYASITAINSQTLTVSNASVFSACDRVLIIQMKGVSINSSNTINYGTISAFNDAGKYEFAMISNVNGNLVTLTSPLLRMYSTNGIIQIIKVPVYNNASVSGTLTCADWNGTTGGVLVFEVCGALSLNGAIDVSGKGFKGATVISGNYTCQGDTLNYVMPSPSIYHAQKGEGVFVSTSINNLGKGKNANGGGGGNNINGGGAGGGNFGVGGMGGDFRSPISCPPNFTMFCGGIGGQNLPYSNTLNLVFMGGGGGTGHQNNGTSTAGGNGGGIVIIRANAIVGNTNFIRADGNNVPTTNSIDGQGGGGAGGSILLDALSFSSLNVSARGGIGGSDTYGGQDCHAKGGGGGGGILWTSSSFAGITTNLSGGNPGLFLSMGSPCYNTSLGATAGSAGGTLGNLILPGNPPVCNSLNIVPNSTLSCSSNSIQLLATPVLMNSSYLWSGPSILGPNSGTSIIATTPGVYTCTLTACNGAIVISAYTVNALGIAPSVTMNAFPQNFCAGLSTTLTAAGATTYTWLPGGLSGSLITAFPPSSMVFTVTGSIGNCNSTQTLLVQVNPLPVLLLSPPNSTLCQRNSVNLTASGADTYLWSNGSVGPTVTLSPTVTTVYTVTGSNSASGCTTSLTHTVTVFSLPVLSIYGPSVACYGETLSYSVTGASNYTWSFGGNGSQINYNPPNSTVFIVTAISSEGCSVGSQFTITLSECLGLNIVHESGEIKISPNPVEDKLIVFMGESLYNKYTGISILDQLGRTIKQFSESEIEIGSEFITLNFSEIIKGVYLLTIQTEEKVFTKKIIKN